MTKTNTSSEARKKHSIMDLSNFYKLKIPNLNIDLIKNTKYSLNTFETEPKSPEKSSSKPLNSSRRVVLSKLINDHHHDVSGLGAYNFKTKSE